MASKLQCWTPHAKQSARQEHKPTHYQRGCQKSYYFHRHPKTHHQTWPCPPERQDPAPPTRTQVPVPSTRKPTLAPEPTSPTGGRHQKQWELRTCSLRKGDPKHSKLSKMGRQRNTQQMKEQSKNPPDKTNKEEIGSLPEKEFRVMIVKMIQNLGIEWREYKKRLTGT